MVVVRICWRFWRVGVVGEGGVVGEDVGEEAADGDGGSGGDMSTVTTPVRELEHDDGPARARARASSTFSSNRSQTVKFLARSAWSSHGSLCDCAGSSAGRNACCGASLKLEYNAAEVGGYNSPDMRSKRDLEVCIVWTGVWVLCSC